MKIRKRAHDSENRGKPGRQNVKVQVLVVEDGDGHARYDVAGTIGVEKLLFAKKKGKGRHTALESDDKNKMWDSRLAALTQMQEGAKLVAIRLPDDTEIEHDSVQGTPGTHVYLEGKVDNWLVVTMKPGSSVRFDDNDEKEHAVFLDGEGLLHYTTMVETPPLK